MRWPFLKLFAPWRIVLAGGVSVALIATPFGLAAQMGTLLVVCAGAFISIVVGVRRRRPNATSPWYVLALSIAILFLSFVLRAAGVGDGQSGPIVPDYFAAVGYVLIMLSVHLLRRLRVNDQDPTNLIDSVVFTIAAAVVLWATFMIPYVKDSSVAFGDRVTGATFAGLDLMLFFSVARLAIGPGARNVSYYMLFSASLGVLLSDVVIDASNAAMAIPGEEVLAILFPSIGFVLCGVAALHSSMVEITKPATVTVARVTTGRLLSMAAAVLIPPILMVLRYKQTGDWSYMEWLSVLCIAITALVMFRFTGIAQARERLADVEHILAEAASSLVSATHKDAMHQAALSAAEKIITSGQECFGVAFVMRKNHEWIIEAEFSNFDVSQVLRLVAELEKLTVYDQKPVQISAGDHSGDLVSAPNAVLIPLVSQGRLRGAIVTYSSAQLNSVSLNALSSLATTFTLAVEAATLAEDLHRQRSDKRFRSLVENSAEVIVVVSADGFITFMSPTAERLLGGRHGDVRALLATVHSEDRLAVLTLLESAKGRGYSHSVECRLIDAEGQVFWFEATASDMRDNNEVEGVVLNAHDITGRKAAEEDLRHKVLHDDLTGIANRALFRDRLDHALRARSERSEGPAVLFIDLDDFKTVNDGLGHGAGDELLKIIAFRLQSFLRAGDTAARLGGDEFAVLLSGITSTEDAEEVASRLSDVIQEPVEFNGREISVSASIGVVVASSGGDSEVLLRNADVAMYYAKSKGRGTSQLFNEAMYVDAIEKLELKGDLAHAIERKELMLYYQPLIDMATGALSGFEALLRWNHSVRGFVSPVTFIPIAEETGYIISIGAWVLRESLQQLAIWSRTMPEVSVKMSINVSPCQLATDDFVVLVSEALQETGVNPERVTLELTETAVLEDDESRQRVEALRALGVGLAADDFGSGFASYAALQQLPFTVVKIDRSLITNFPDPSGKADAQIRSIIDMAHATGLTVVAEGIEEPIQRDSLAALGCDRGQGFLFGKPVPQVEAVQWIRSITDVLGSQK